MLESDVFNMYFLCQRCLSLYLLSQESSWIENCCDRNELPLKRGRESGFSGTIGQDVTFPLDMTSQPTPLCLVTFTVDLRPAAVITRYGSSVMIGKSANSSGTAVCAPNTCTCFVVKLARF